VLDLKIAGLVPRMRSEGPSRRFGQVGPPERMSR